MYKILYALILMIWIVDILNMNIIINGINLHTYLDVTIPINGWAWFLIWLLLPSSTEVKIVKEK